MQSGLAQSATTNGRTLLIYLPEVSGVSTDPIPLLKDWASLVEGRPDVVVAVPGDHGGAGMSIPMVTEIIDDTVAHDHVNPRHVFWSDMLRVSSPS